MTQSAVPVPLDILPQQLHEVLDHSGEVAIRMMIARAALPMPPDQLLPLLAYLCLDPEETVRETASASLKELPENIVLAAVKNKQTHPGVIHQVADQFLENNNLMTSVVLNRAAANETLILVAKAGPASALNVLSKNQARIARQPELVEAIYYNRKTDMSAASELMEFAIREDLPIHGMKGYKDIAAGILGDDEFRRRQEHREDEAAEDEEQLPQALPMEDEAGLEALEAEAARLEEESADPVVDRLLEPYEEEAQEEPAPKKGEPAEEPESEGEKKGGQSLTDKLRDMAIPARIRLALMGNKAARKLLISDASRLVAGAVMRNPGLSDKEVADTARNKNANEEVVRIICNNREWVKNYHVKMGLVANPKTPTHKAMNILKGLADRDLKRIARSREVPVGVSRFAKRLIGEREKARKKK